MSKPICKTKGCIGPDTVCDFAGAFSGRSGDILCQREDPDMCRRSNVYNEGLTPKPCPMCKRDEELYLSHDEVNWVLGCVECGLELDKDFGTKEEAIAAWNTRP